MPSIQTICLVAASLAASAAAADWDYNELGDDWYKKYPLCKTGKQQSPIDVTRYSSQLSPQTKIEMKGGYKNYVGANQISVIDKGYTIQSNFPGDLGQNGEFDRDFYGKDAPETRTLQALQMHIHAPSEHTINGYHFDAEIHVVHLYDDGSLGGVIGVLFDREAGGDTTNPLIQ